MDSLKRDVPAEGACGYKCGYLPDCAPLATAWTPMQQENPPMYEGCEALTRGTLFPGLDLPFKNIINKSNPYAGTPLGELMALWFIIKELQLYLDTHKGDREALKALQETIALEREGHRRYVKLYGPLNITDVELADCYSWVDGPWPWEYDERTGKK